MQTPATPYLLLVISWSAVRVCTVEAVWSLPPRRLEALGYEHVYDYEEGKQDWIEAGLPTESGAMIAER